MFRAVLMRFFRIVRECQQKYSGFPSCTAPTQVLLSSTLGMNSLRFIYAFFDLELHTFCIVGDCTTTNMR